MGRYVTTQNVLDIGGDVALIWGDFASGVQGDRIARIEAQIDEYTGQAGGVQRQLAKSLTILPRWSSDTLPLANSPVTAVSAITVTRAGTPTMYPTGAGQIRIVGGSQLVYIPSSPIVLPPFRVGDAVAVTYDSGYATIPACVIRCALFLLEQAMFYDRENGRAVSSESSESGTLQFLSALEVEYIARDMLAPVTIPAASLPLLAV